MSRAATEVPSILVYRCRIPDWGDLGHLQSILGRIPPHLHVDITRYKRVQDQLARVVARRLVSKAMDDSGLGEFSNLCGWQKNCWGRPFISGIAADFSISHSGSWVVAALSVNARVGVDVENFRHMELDSIRPYLSARELDTLAGTADPQREAVKCWSRREAILKADGRGLLAPEEVIRDIWKLEQPAGGRWRVDCFEIEQTCLYLATDGYESPVAHTVWDFPDLC